jgi:hypothetical protein
MSEESLEPARHEPKDVGEWFIWIGSIGLAAAVVFFGFVVYLLFPHALRDWSLNLPLPDYPAPRQQTHPRADMQNFVAKEMQRLNSAGWINKPEGTVHIPIQDAMRIIAQEKIPGWPGPPENSPVAQAETSPGQQSKEQAHETALPSPPVDVTSPTARSASAALCGKGAGARRHCLRSKARKRASRHSHG